MLQGELWTRRLATEVGVEWDTCLALWTIFVEQEDGTYRLRIRSKKPVINELAKEYGGGGHPLASGARLEDASGIPGFVEKLDDVAAKYTEEK